MADEPTQDTHDDGPTKTELLAEARELDIPGRTTMDADELAAAIALARAEPLVTQPVPQPPPIAAKGQTAASLQAAITNANLSTTALDEAAIAAALAQSLSPS